MLIPFDINDLNTRLNNNESWQLATCNVVAIRNGDRDWVAKLTGDVVDLHNVAIFVDVLDDVQDILVIDDWVISIVLVLDHVDRLDRLSTVANC